MIKFKCFFVVIVFLCLTYSCKKDNNKLKNVNFDYKTQSIKDNNLIVNFLKGHYYDSTLDSIKRILNSNKLSLFKDSKLKTIIVKDDEVDYKLYLYVINKGVSLKGNPTFVDSVFINYRGQKIFNKDSLSLRSFDRGKNIWLTLSSVIQGWSMGLTNLKGGINITNNGPFKFKDYGKAILFIPSGLAYKNKGKGNVILPNQNLIFYIDLLDIVKDTDHDQDGVPSIKEDINGDENIFNDDNDNDGKPNFMDKDDDGDGKLTIDEDKNGDGDPSNDFNDQLKPNTPDYLNSNIK